MGDGDGTGAMSGDGDGTGAMSGDGDGDGTLTMACPSFTGLGDCGTQAVAATRNDVNILLVLDKSKSMNDVPEEGSSTSLWDATRAALTDALAETSDEVSFGLQLYPQRDEGIIPLSNCYPYCCEMPTAAEMDVPIAPGQETRDAILTRLSSTFPGGGTPTGAALERAYDYFKDGAGAALEGKKFVLLATDGGPNCNADATCELESCTVNIDDQCQDPEVNCCASNTEGCLDDSGVSDQILALRDLGVDTFVVGLTGSEAYAAQLNEFAKQGGRSREGADDDYFRVDAEGSAEGLSGVLDEITRTLVQSCEVELSETPPDLNQVNVAVDCDVVPRAEVEPGAGQGGEGSDAESGWDFDLSTTPPTAVIHGPLCDKIESEGAQQIDVLFGCPVVR